MDRTAAFQGEMMLLNWTESSTRGRTATFLLDETTDEHPMKKFTIKSGKHAGQRFAVMMVLMDDDEQPLPPEQKPSEIAGMLCRDPQFWRWADERALDKIDSEDAARNWICALLSIKSRRELDKDASLQRAFDAQVVGPFNEYRRNVNKPL
jgi:hypothetical protein